MMPEERFRIAGSQIVADVIEGEAIVMDLSKGAYFSLQGSGAAMWLLLGVHAWILLRQIVPGSSISWPLATGVFALAWLVGFLVVLAPAGAGVREVAILSLIHI